MRSIAMMQRNGRVVTLRPRWLKVIQFPAGEAQSFETVVLRMATSLQGDGSHGQQQQSAAVGSNSSRQQQQSAATVTVDLFVGSNSGACRMCLPQLLEERVVALTAFLACYLYHIVLSTVAHAMTLVCKTIRSPGWISGNCVFRWYVRGSRLSICAVLIG